MAIILFDDVSPTFFGCWLPFSFPRIQLNYVYLYIQFPKPINDMKFSEHASITFTLKKFSFDEISPEVSKFVNKNVTMKFKEGKVYLLGQTWQGKEIEINNDMIVLYLFCSNDKNIFRISHA